MVNAVIKSLEIKESKAQLFTSIEVFVIRQNLNIASVSKRGNHTNFGCKLQTMTLSNSSTTRYQENTYTNIT